MERAIEAGDEETGVTIMRPIAELDAGPISLQRAEAISPDDDYGSLSGRLAPLGGELLVEALDGTARLPRAARRGNHLRRKDRARRATARPHDARRRAGTAGAGADAAHRGLHQLPWGERLGVVRAGLGPRRAPRRARWRRATAGCSTARPPARSNCSRSIRPASGRWTRGVAARKPLSPGRLRRTG